MTDFSVAVHPIALPKPAAAAALGMSVDSFERYVQADVRCITARTDAPLPRRRA